MKKVLNPLERKWEFETNEGYVADLFLQILELFKIGVDDIYVPSYLDMSQIEFRTTKAKRQQIDYVFRHYICENLIGGLWDARWNKQGERNAESVVELEGGDWYAIY